MMPIICGEILLQLKSQVEIFQNSFTEIVSSFGQVISLHEQVFGSEERSK